MFIGSLLIVFASLKFPGGTVDHLIGFFQKHIDAQIVIGCDFSEALPFKLAQDEKKTLVKRIAKAIRREAREGDLPVFGMATLPSAFSAPGYDWSPEPDGEPIASKAVSIEGNKLALNTLGKGHYPLRLLKDEKLSRPLKLHWMFDDMAVKGITGYLPEEELLKAIAWACLGTLKKTDNLYEIAIDAKRFKKAYAQWASGHADALAQRNQSYAEVLRWRLTASAVLLCSDSQIDTMMRTPTSRVSLKVLPYGNCNTLVREFVRATFYPREGEGGAVNPQYQLLENVDPRALPEVELRPRVPCTVTLRYRDGKGGLGF